MLLLIVYLSYQESAVNNNCDWFKDVCEWLVSKGMALLVANIRANRK